MVWIPLAVVVTGPLHSSTSVASGSVALVSVVHLTFCIPADPLIAEVAGTWWAGTPLYVVQLAPVTDPGVEYVMALPKAKQDTNKIATAKAILFVRNDPSPPLRHTSFRCEAQAPFSDRGIAI